MMTDEHVEAAEALEDIKQKLKEAREGDFSLQQLKAVESEAILLSLESAERAAKTPAHFAELKLGKAMAEGIAKHAARGSEDPLQAAVTAVLVLMVNLAGPPGSDEKIATTTITLGDITGLLATTGGYLERIRQAKLAERRGELAK